MNVLAVDTSSERGSVALARDGNLLEVVTLPSGWRSVTLHSEIVRLLDHHGWTTRDIHGYGVTIGPGSFTGVRVGLTAVKGLAEIHGAAIIPVSTLQTLAAAAKSNASALSVSSALSVPSVPSVPAFIAIQDARRGQIFGAVYRVEGDWFRTLVEECVCSLASFLDRIKQTLTTELATAEPKTPFRNDMAICGTDLAPLIPEIEKAGWGQAPLINVDPSLAGPLAQLATQRLKQGLGVTPMEAEANYIRPSDAELFWKG